MDLDYFFKKDQVIKVTAENKQMVIHEMVDKLQDLGIIDNKSRYYAQIVHREALENTAIGSGLAIPHARTESVDSFISIFGIHEHGIDYNSPDGKPVNYILLSIFPTQMSTTYLYFVGMLARIFSNPEKKRLIDEARTPVKTYTVLKKEAESYFKSISEKNSTEALLSDSPAGLPSSDLDMLIRLDRLYKLYDSGHTKGIQEKIDEIKKLIDNRSFTYYERMRNKQSNPFAIVEKGSCSGCHMGIPPVYLKQSGDKVSVCTHCGRFLIVV
ncbi:MAG: PTS sugar transporter subunit IIA [Leptospirales bacterium]|nr:PTS sugar transporter subunit IIA [Leptospirales bacterium]